MDFFNQEIKTQITKQAPLAYRMRPGDLSEYAGQKHILAEGKLLWRAIKADRITSLILYGPPGVGKTALAFIIGRHSKASTHSVNAVNCGVETLRKIIHAADEQKQLGRAKTILFIDEIHRFNRSQQDVLMPAIESEKIILIGATTFNPFHALIPPLISRSLIFELKSLSVEEILEILNRALADKERGLGEICVEVRGRALDIIATLCDGDARKALTALDVACLTTPKDGQGVVVIDEGVALESIQKKMVVYDRRGDAHYDTISAFIKSLRGSNPDAAVYWLAKMLYAEEDPLFIARRMIIFASEDIGNANPHALTLAVSCYGAVETVGLPEAEIILAHVTCYLAASAKSNACYVALKEAKEDVKNVRTQEVPQHLKEAGYPGAEKLGRGKGYIYSHDYPQESQDFLVKNRKYYRPEKKV